MTKKIKVLTLSDHPLVPSGVGSQTRYMIEGLLKTGRYEFRSIAGAMKHQDYRPMKLEEYKEDWIIYPVDGYGDASLVRHLMDLEKPDAVWFMTDPRFFIWLFEMSDEIRDRGIPLLYNHVWDELPVPKFNKPLYECCDFIGCISKLTHHIVKELGMSDRSRYIPHAVDRNIFKRYSPAESIKFKTQHIGVENCHKFVVFYNSRNARRKMTADIVRDFKLFADKVGNDKVFLFMHTDPHDQEGSNLWAVADMVGLAKNQFKFSSQGLPPTTIAEYYNLADVTVNISNNEGFGISCLESLSCGTLAIVNKTGGLQDQIVDENGKVFGACLTPAVMNIMGSQQIPFIFDARVADWQVVEALEKLYHTPKSERLKLGEEATAWTDRAFSMNSMISSWDDVITENVAKYANGGFRKMKVASF